MRSYIRINDSEKAKACLREAIAVIPGNYNFTQCDDYIAVAEAYAELHENERAKEALSKATALLPSVSHGEQLLYASLASAYITLALPDKAKEVLNKAAKAARYGLDYIGIAKEYARCGDAGKAEKALEYALQRTTLLRAIHHAPMYLWIADAYAGLNRFEKAKQTLSQAMESLPSLDHNPFEEYCRAAGVYLKIHEPERAKEILREALEKVPEIRINYLVVAKLYHSTC